MPRTSNKKLEYAIELIENEIKAAEASIELNLNTKNFARVFGGTEYKSGLERALAFIKPCASNKRIGGTEYASGLEAFSEYERIPGR